MYTLKVKLAKGISLQYLAEMCHRVDCPIGVFQCPHVYTTKSCEKITRYDWKKVLTKEDLYGNSYS